MTFTLLVLNRPSRKRILGDILIISMQTKVVPFEIFNSRLQLKFDS
jgi:hypothetical protein